jgi:hypothetical protein
MKPKLTSAMVGMLLHIGNGNLPSFRARGATQTYYGLRHRGLVDVECRLTEAGRAEYLRIRGLG